MQYVAVISASGKRLMPTTSYRARKLLKSGRAEIHSYRPIFCIRLLDREDGSTQPIEYKSDTGYEHIGISICSQEKEFVNEQLDTLKDETERHNDRSKYRKARRNRLRYRKPRWGNRKGLIAKGGFAPSIRHRRDIQIQRFLGYCKVMPVTRASFEMGMFDTQLLKAMEQGKSIPEGTDYQHGQQYGHDNLREAVFARDDYICQCCKKKGKILRIHHIGFRRGDRTNRMSNLLSVCTDCHTSKNHKPGGTLYDLEPELKPFKGAAFMTSVRWDMIRKLKATVPGVDVHFQYGSLTKHTRKMLGVKKSHSNDAYCIGEFRPKHRADFAHWQKSRRNNRILQKFRDAKYIDIRDGQAKSGAQLSCGRKNRKEPRMSERNERKFRGQKIRFGSCPIRRRRHLVQAGDMILYKGRRYCCHGTMSGGKSILLLNKEESPTGKAVTCAPSKCRVLVRNYGWKKAS